VVPAINPLHISSDLLSWHCKNRHHGIGVGITKSGADDLPNVNLLWHCYHWHHGIGISGTKLTQGSILQHQHSKQYLYHITTSRWHQIISTIWFQQSPGTALASTGRIDCQHQILHSATGMNHRHSFYVSKQARYESHLYTCYPSNVPCTFVTRYELRVVSSLHVLS
jgi:hypothetical protein